MFKAATSEIDLLLPGLVLLDPETFKSEVIISTLGKFAELSPLLKGKLVSACMRAVLFDDNVSIHELEVMRSVCTVMNIPVPPVLIDKTKVKV